MADIFLNSVDGSDANSGADWTAEKLTLATGIAGIDAAGDRVLINSSHAESATAVSYTCPGTATNPCQLLSVTPTGTTGISALTAGATFTGTSTGLTFNGSFYAYGLSLVASTGNIVSAVNSGDVQHWDTCTFNVSGASGSARMIFGTTASAGGSVSVLTNCTFQTGNSGQRISYSGDVRINGGAWSASGTDPASIFIPYGGAGGARGQSLVVQGLDLTNIPTTTNLMGQGQAGANALFRDILLPASWTGVPIGTSDIEEGMRVEVWHYKVGSSWVRFWVRDTRCDLTPETTIVRSGGGADAEGSYSVKMVTTSACAYPTAVARSMTFVVPNTTTGSNVTLTAQIIRDSATALDDDEVWLEVEEPDGTITTDAAASVIATPAAQTSSGATWTTTGMTNPNEQELAVTVNPSVAGPLLVTVHCAKPSTTLYICPKVDKS